MTTAYNWNSDHTEQKISLVVLFPAPRRQTVVSERKENTILKILTCSFFPCTQALVPILLSPRTGCYVHGHTQSLPGSQRARKPSTVIYFAGSTLCYGCNWDSGVADLARLSLAASVNMQGLAATGPSQLPSFTGFKGPSELSAYRLVLLCSGMYVHTHTYSCIYWAESRLSIHILINS